MPLSVDADHLVFAPAGSLAFHVAQPSEKLYVGYPYEPCSAFMATSFRLTGGIYGVACADAAGGDGGCGGQYQS